MRPVSRKALHTSKALQSLSSNSSGSIRGVTKLKGVQYPNCITALYLKRNLSPVAIVKSDEQGRYSFLGLPTEEAYFVVAFDPQKLKNAVIRGNRLAR